MGLTTFIEFILSLKLGVASNAHCSAQSVIKFASLVYNSIFKHNPEKRDLIV